MKKTLFTISLTVVFLLSISTIPAPPVEAWIYPDGTEDLRFERFGPRADKLLIHLYNDPTAVWTALKAGDIDMTDSPLFKEVYEELTAPPYLDSIRIANYGPEYGLFLIDLNSNNNQYLGNPPDPAYVNPMADRDPGTGNPLIGGGAGPANDQNPLSDVNLRRAIGYLIDRPGLIADPTIGAGFGFPMYTMIPVGMPKYLLDVYGDPTMPWAWSYDPAAAAALLDANGFPINTATGYRYWDRNSNGNEEADEYVEIVFYIRSDHLGRNHIGTVLVAEMAGIDLRVNPQFATSGTCFVEVMVNKDFHLYTGDWSLGVDPDFLINWSWDYYWHPGFCYNYGGHNHPDFNAAADGITYANDQPEAVMYAMMAQEAQAREVLSIPLYCASGNKAMSGTYVGDTPEEQAAGYTGQLWNGTVNTVGYGIDNRWSFMNMLPQGCDGDTGDGENMTIRYGLSVPEIQYLNPVYASRPSDWKVLNQIYESLLVRNASDPGQFLSWLVEEYEMGTYTHPTLGECSRIRFTLRSDVTWSDSTNLTAADVYFTFVELKQILDARGLPPPSWYRNVQDILSFSVLDYYNFEVLLGVKSYWALDWLGGNIILPRHVWQPICESGDPVTHAPDPNMVGTGPWRLQEYLPQHRILMVANMPNSTVQTNLPRSSPTFSEKGYFQTCPLLEELWLRMSPDSKTRRFNWQDLEFFVNVVFEGLAEEPWAFTLLEGPYPIVEMKLVTPNVIVGWLQLVPAYTPLELYLVLSQHTGNLTQYCDNPGIYELCIRIHYEYQAKVLFFWKKTIRTPYLYVTYDFIYGTIKWDIAGNFMINPLIPVIDGKVDIKDVATASQAFGSYPGHPRWSVVGDINGDYKIDIKDIAAIAKWFGWVG